MIFDEYSEIFQDYKQTLFNCIVASQVVYYDDPLKKLQSDEFNVYKHTLEELAVSYTDEDSRNPFSLQTKYMIGVNNGLKQIVVAFRGTKSFNDKLADIQLFGKLNGCQGRFHSGIYHRSEEIPIAYFINKIKEGYQVVFTGHSLGAAVGALVAIRVLLHNSIWGDDSKKNKVLFIGFGSPAFADNHFKEYIELKYKINFHFYVNENDSIVKVLNWLSNFFYSNEEVEENYDSVIRIISKFVLPNYAHFGETLFLGAATIERNDFSSNFDIQELVKNPDLLMKTIQNHYSKNYSRKIVSLLGNNFTCEPKPGQLSQLKFLDIPAELTEIQPDEIGKNNNCYSLELVRTEFETDVFINICCSNFEYVTGGMLEVKNSQNLHSPPHGAKKLTFQYENDEKISFQLSFSVLNAELVDLNNIEVTCLLDTHFQKGYKLPLKITKNHFKKQEFTHKEALIEDMPVDLLYIYAMNYIYLFRNIEHEKYKTNCETLQLILNAICKIWELDVEKKHEFSNDELNGVLFSYFMKDASNSNLDLVEQRFGNTFVNLTDHLCEKNTKKFIQDVLPTCYYLKQQQSILFTWDNTRWFFTNIYNAITKYLIYPFERITSDDGYLNTLRSFKSVDFKDVSPYAGCYERAIAEKKDLTDSKILKTIKLNRQLRTILKDGFICGVIGKKNCGKSTFVEKMLPGVNANASALIGTVNTGVYLTEPDSHVFFDYAHFDSLNFSHKLQFIFSRKLLNFVFMVCNAMERMDSNDTMKIFKIIKNGHDCNYVILLNRADEILADCRDESDYGKNIVEKLLMDVRDRCGLATQKEKERIWLTCLKNIENLNEQNNLSNVKVLFGDVLKAHVENKIRQIICQKTKSIEEKLPYKQVSIQNEKGFIEVKLVITNDINKCPPGLENVIDTDEKLQNELSLFKIGPNIRFRLKNKHPSIKDDNKSVFKTIDELLKANGASFIIFHVL